mgnify:CR=1 FL=1
MRLAAEKSKATAEARRDHYRGRIGDGRGRVEIDTGSGGVRIVRS